MGYRSDVAVRVAKERYLKTFKPFLSKLDEYSGAPDKLLLNTCGNDIIVTMYWEDIKWYINDLTNFVEDTLRKLDKIDEPYDFIIVGEDGDTEGTIHGFDDYIVDTYSGIQGFNYLTEVNESLTPLFKKERAAYKKYKIEWLKDHISSEDFMNKYIEYLEEKDFDKIDVPTFEKFIEADGFNGQIYSCFSEWLQNEYKN